MSLRKNHIEIHNASSSEVSEQKIMDISSQWSIQYPITTSESFDKLQQRIGRSSIKVKSRTIKSYLAIAASITFIIIAFIGITITQNTVKIVNGLATIKTIYLPDSSKVILNADSYLSYNINGWGKGERNLEMTGHAYFEVKKGSNFTVSTTKGTVEVLGTSFNVYDRNSGFSVECFTGKVAVSTNSSSVLLTKGLKTSLTNQELEPAQKFNTNKKEWITGVFNFYNTPVDKVFEEIERQYNVSIEHKTGKIKSYTGTFNTKNLERTLLNVCKPLGFNFTIEQNNKIIIFNQ